jgi:predicted nucleic acid-binding protein
MPACVIDTSAIIAVLLSEPDRAMLIEKTHGMELLAPASVHWEIGNALSAGIRRRRLTAAEAQRALEAYAEIPIRFVEVHLSPSVELAAGHGMYAYDAYVLTCAQQQRVPILTLDVALARVASTIGLNLVLPLP